MDDPSPLFCRHYAAAILTSIAKFNTKGYEMHGRGVTTVAIAMMAFVGGNFAAHQLGAQNSKFSQSYNSLKPGPAQQASPAVLAQYALLHQKVFAARSYGNRPQFIGAKVSLRYAGFNWRQGAIKAKNIVVSWKNSLIASYQRFPAIVLGLAGLVIVPMLALPGLILRIVRAISRGYNRRIAMRRARITPQPAFAPPTHHGASWIRVEGGDKQTPRAKLDGEMLRIGRERDNDICLDARSVHRYHALVHRTPDQEILITDLSGKHGNGMWVNGTRLQSVVLHHGDRIQLGQVQLKYELGQG